MLLFVFISLICSAFSGDILLPRRLEREDVDITVIPLTISSMQLDDTLNLAKDIVVQRRKLEMELEKTGN